LAGLELNMRKPQPRWPRRKPDGHLRILFLHEGILGGGDVMGHATYEGSVRVGLQDADDVEARFSGLPEMDRVSKALTLSWPGLSEPDLDLQTVRWHAVQAFRARQVLREALAEWRPDVIHVKSHSIAMGVAGQVDGVPVVPVIDATVMDWRGMAIWRPMRRHSSAMVAPSVALERRALARSPLVLALTKWAHDAVIRVCPQARVVQHHPGIDLERYIPAPRMPRSKARVLFVGGRFEAKGGFELLRALGSRLGTEVDLDVVTTEDVPEMDGVRVHRLRTGQPELVELYQQADVLCLPTHGDSNPWVLLEAMACGTPAISTSVGAIPELLGHGTAGVIVRPGDVEALARAIDRLLANDAERRELGEAGRERVERFYDARHQVPLLWDLLRTAAGLSTASSDHRQKLAHR
jgi:glycosyltransferase involved in cell wall biosynthesis